MTYGLSALALLGAYAAVLTGQARADEIYTLSGTYPGAQLPFVTRLDLTDAQVETGAFTLSEPGNNGANPNYTGDAGGFVSLRLSADTLTPTYAYGRLSALSLTFDGAGDLETVNVNWLGENSDVTITGTGASAIASFREDDPYVCPNSYNGTPGGECTLTGSFVRTGDPLPAPAPEPAALALLGAGLTGLGLARSRLRSERHG